MNKTIREATKEEVANAYINKVPLLIYNYRKYSLEREINQDTGEVITFCRFNLPMAKKYNLGFEFRIWQSNKMRKRRLKERVSRIVRSNRAKFLTLTFNNSFLGRETSEETRRRYIRRFLKEQCSEYVANVDYGESEKHTHREHYHAIVVPKGERIDYQPYCDFFDGSRIHSEEVKCNEKSNISISLYINKLTNHSLKASGQYKRLIYSRTNK